MRKILALLLAFSLYLLSLPPALARDQDQPAGKFREVEAAIPDHYIVVLNDDIPRRDVAGVAAELARAHGGVTRHIYRHTVKGFSVRLPERAAVALSHDPRVAFVEEDAEVFAVGTQQGAVFGLDRIDQRFLPLNGSYTYNRVGSGVHVYVLDTGIRPTHKEFGRRAFAAFDAFGLDGLDCYGHGTHVAGTIGGRTYGVAKNARLFSVRVLSRFCDNSGQLSDVIAGVDWVTANHVKPAVANMSLGGPASDSLDAAVRRSIAAGITYVIAAGNDNVDASSASPARVREAITVGATDSSDTRALFPTWGSNFGSVLDLFAPGVGILSAWWNTDTSLETSSGTSMAAPHVAGVVAQYLEAFPSATPGTASSALVNNATFGVVNNAGPGSPNRLLFSGFVPAPATHPVTGSRFFTRQHYYDFLRREPDPGGWDMWTNYIEGCGGEPSCVDARRKTTTRGFIESIEFRQSNPVLRDNPAFTDAYNREYVRQLYLCLLQRDPDPDGYNMWVNFINSSGDYDHLVGGFINSLEYAARFV